MLKIVHLKARDAIEIIVLTKKIEDKIRKDLKDRKETRQESNNPPCSFDQSKAPVQDT
jgi:hypothetical protein